MYAQNEKVADANLSEEMQRAYIDYSMSVIVGRALPDARDGLKPSNRRVLYAMREIGLFHNRSYTKCAKVVGEVLGKYHPHGDASVYDTLVRMAQDFAMRYPLIDGQGNFGSIDGDPAAAYRYTECRLEEIAEELLADLDKDTVDFVPNFDEKEKEPVVLPSRIPNLLVNGSTGIAVGMATNIPPHNLNEIVDACCALIDEPETELEKIAKIVKGADFPTGGLICGKQGIKDYLLTGRGSLKIRGRIGVEEVKGGKERLVISQIPYIVNKASLIENIARLVNDKKLDDISDIRDESNKDGIRVVIELKRDAIPKVVINNLFKHTQLEDTFGVIMLAIDHGRPRTMNIKQMIECYIAHRKEVITRRTKFELQKAEERAHILEGFRIALDNIDAIVKIIKGADDREDPEGHDGEEHDPQNPRPTAGRLADGRGLLGGLQTGQVDEQPGQVCPRLRAHGPVQALLELGGVQASVAVVLGEQLADLVALGVADPQVGVAVGPWGRSPRDIPS